MPYINKAMHIFNIFESFLTQVVPPVLIVVMNGFIIHGLARLNQTFQAGSNKHRSSSVSANHSHCRKITSIRVSSADAACQAQKLRIFYSNYFCNTIVRWQLYALVAFWHRPWPQKE